MRHSEVKVHLIKKVRIRRTRIAFLSVFKKSRMREASRQKGLTCQWLPDYQNKSLFMGVLGLTPFLQKA